jgi:hypothetical protein
MTLTAIFIVKYENYPLNTIHDMKIIFRTPFMVYNMKIALRKLFNNGKL